MIYAYTGKTGSGKTFQMVRDAYSKWHSGYDIYSNTVLFFAKRKEAGKTAKEVPAAFSIGEKIRHFVYRNTLKLFRKPYKPLKRGNISYFTNINEIIHVRNAVILFDEAQVLFNARLWDSLPPEFQYKLQQHRKHDLHLYCTTQNLGTIDITYRRLIHGWYHHEKVFGIGKKLVLLGFFRQNEKDIDMIYNTVDDLKADTVKTRRFLIHKLKRRLYDTFYDIGFKRFRTIWRVNMNLINDHKFTSDWIMLPKEMTLAEGLKAISSSGLGSKQRRYRN